MNIISLAWTTDVFLANAKNVTRRYWKPSHAKKFKEGDIVQAYDKIPLHGGKNIGCIKITKKPYLQPTGNMTENDYAREGFLWMEQQGKKIKGEHPRTFFEKWRNQNDTVWVVEFEKTSCPINK